MFDHIMSINKMAAKITILMGIPGRSSGHFPISSLDSVLSSSENGASGFPVLENNKGHAASIESVLCTLYILQTIVSEDIMVSSVSSPMPTFFSKPWCFLTNFHDYGVLPCLSFKDGC